MNVVVDSGETGLFMLIKTALKENVGQGPLPIGDVLVVGELGSVLIERKTAEDFIASMDSGHLKDQLERMQRIEDTACVVAVEGNIGAAIAKVNRVARRANPITLPQVQGQIASIIYRYGFSFVNFKDVEWTVSLVKYIAKKDVKMSVEDGIRKLRLGTRMSRTNEKLQYILEGFTGPKTAVRLLEEYQTVPNVIRAIIDAPQSVAGIPGIGEKTVEKWRELLTAKFERE